MFIKTVSTTSGINPIKFDETSGVFYWILNTGSSTVYASTEKSFSAGDDGVVSLGPKESRRLETKNDTIYILGEGQVEIHNQRDGICSFKQAPTSYGGGGTVDAYTKTESDARYAQKSEIPTELPANGGNADTLGGVGITSLRQITQTVIDTLPAAPNGEGDYLVNCSQSDTSFPYPYGHLSIRYGSYTKEYVAIFRTTGNDDKVYYNTYLTNHWSGWQEISVTPIKSTTFSGTTDTYSHISLWAKSENKIPILFECENKIATIFYGSSGYFYAYVTDNLHQNINETAVSGTVWYVELAEVII